MVSLSKFDPYIVADIGGTNSRFGLVTSIDKAQQKVVIENLVTFKSSEFSSLEDAVLGYKESLNSLEVKQASLAVAGPVVGDKIKLTNLDWNFSILETKHNLDFKNLMIINDFTAYACSIQYLDKSCFQTIHKGIAVENYPQAVLGPGTGFGVALLINQAGAMNALALEGGHMSLAANTPLQAAIKEFMSRRFNFVSVERVFSGPGLRYLYQALAAVEGSQTRNISTAQISQYALDGSDEMCQRTLSLFCSWLGSIIGDFALTLGARGGIYLGGGILPRIVDFLRESEFEAAFKSKGQMSYYLEEIPVQLVTKSNTALIGAAAWFENHIGERM